MIVRLARAGDAADIARIYNEGIEDAVATFETDARSAEQMAELLRDKGDKYPTVVVEHEGRIVAWAGASTYRSLPARRRPAPASPVASAAIPV